MAFVLDSSFSSVISDKCQFLQRTVLSLSLFFFHFPLDFLYEEPKASDGQWVGWQQPGLGRSSCTLLPSTVWTDLRLV